MDLDKAIKSRRSVREFKIKKVPWDKVLEAIDAAIQAPAAANSLPLKFIIVESKEKIDKMAELSGQDWVSDSKIVIAVCSNDSPLESLYNERGKIYARQQAGAAIENFLLKITDLGLSSCWIGSYHEDLMKQLLKVPGHINIEAILPIGYAKGKSKEIKKPSLENSINWEEWGSDKKPLKSQEPKW